MSVRRLCSEQPASFAFSPENKAWAENVITKYPQGQQASAVIPLLWRAQEQFEGWLSEPAIRAVADMLGMAYIRVYEVATFYTMFQLAPVGRKAHVQVCGTTPCMLRGAGDLIKVCKSRISKKPHEVSGDGDFSWEEVECLGSCANAPMVQIFKDTYEDLSPQLLGDVLDGFVRGMPLRPGSQIGRQASCPVGGPTTLTDPTLGEVRSAEPGTVAGTRAVVAGPAQPAGLSAPRGLTGDNLQRIGGIGGKAEALLHSLGIYHYDQIAAWEPDTVAWVNNFLRFKGRIERENWVAQAKVLAAGGETVFSVRMDARSKPDNGGGGS